MRIGSLCLAAARRIRVKRTMSCSPGVISADDRGWLQRVDSALERAVVYGYRRHAHNQRVLSRVSARSRLQVGRYQGELRLSSNEAV